MGSGETYFLTDDQAVLLDGLLDAKQQMLVDAAKRRIAMRKQFPDLSDGERKLLEGLVAEARTNGLVIWRHKSIRRCAVCEKFAGYAVVSRNTRTKRKGEQDFDKPLSMFGVEFANRFVSFEGSVSLGCCVNCAKNLAPHIETILSEVPHERRWPNFSSKWKKYDNCKCGKCGWDGHEGQMIRHPTIMGDGTYPAECPQCHAMNTLFSTVIKTVGGFTLVESDKEQR